MSNNQELPEIRQLEAIGFRSWPAEFSHFDGTWVVRRSPGHDAKRINSVNPMDRGDYKDLEQRVNDLANDFGKINRPLTFRLTPLAPVQLAALFRNWNWQRIDESRVMLLDLATAGLEDAITQLPLKDVAHWIDQGVA
ncbi:MAG: GNAT family N-acetyltransferase, partial [Rhizobiaceae bacterium]